MKSHENEEQFLFSLRIQIKKIYNQICSIAMKSETHDRQILFICICNETKIMIRYSDSPSLSHLFNPISMICKHTLAERERKCRLSHRMKQQQVSF